VPRGRITELLGPAGSGATSLARRLVGQALAAGAWVAYVDATRTLAPRDWAGAEPADGASRLWVVRPPDPTRAAWCADVLLRSGGFGLVLVDGAPVLSRAVALRLLQLARDADAALVLLGAGTRASDLGGALRLRLRAANGAGREPAAAAGAPAASARRTGDGAPSRGDVERGAAGGDHGGEGWDSSQRGGELCGRRGASPVCASRGSRSAPCGAPGRERRTRRRRARSRRS
jgi:hypothetical protein